MASAAVAGNYVCRLDAATEKKARDELNEDPKDRLNAVEALRTWIQQQPHLTFRTETQTLLFFLRTAKFSQLKAREMIENYAKAITKNRHWFQDIDTHDPNILEVIESGYVVPLPKKDKNGCTVLLYNTGATRKNGKMFTVESEIRAGVALLWYVGMDENFQVNGVVFVFDMTSFSMKHMTRWSMEDLKNWNASWQNSMPGRFKAFHHYSDGTIFETLMAISRPFLSKKMQDRVHVHDTLESLYKYVDMELLPDEYLPDDYQGPSAGPLANIIDNFKRDITDEKFRQMLLEETSERSYGIDESKRPSYKVVKESFRKLAVD
jgi:hypothetical protein